MTRPELIDALWAELPATKHIAGRRRVERVIERALNKWPTMVLVQCDGPQSHVVGKHMARGLERQERAEYGMGFFTAIILSALISEIIKRLMQRWVSDRMSIMEALQ